MSRDALYAQPLAELGAFRFDERVAAVFPDMIRRSVPGYPLLLELLQLVAARYAQPHSRLYDLGCSLGASSLALRAHLNHPGCRLVAVDNSPAMLERCRQILAATPGPDAPVDIVCADLRQVRIERASVVVLNFTLQFIPPRQRLGLLRAIHHGLLPGGVLVLSEKLEFADPAVQTEFTELHHAFKRAHGYSELEISQKRSALENVLVPETLARHRRRLRAAGFARSEVWLQSLNFASVLAWKSN